MKRITTFLLAAFVAATGFAQVTTDNTKTGILSAPFLGSSTYAALPTCGATYSGYRARATDIGTAPGMQVVCDGANWVPDGPQTLWRSAIPMILTPTGSVGNNGSVTVGTVLPSTYSAAYMHFPANAIVAGSAAGFYYTSMSSTTTGTVYNNPYTGGIPSIPSSTVSFSTTGPGAFTAVTTTVTLSTLTIPGKLMGTSGSIDIETIWSATNNANAKTPTLSFGSLDMFPTALTSIASLHDSRVIANRGSASAQVAVIGGFGGGWGGGAGLDGYGTVNTASDVTLTIKATKATATDAIILEGFRVRASP